MLCALALAAWLIGRVVSDRYGWSQWLLWIPTPAAIATAVVALLVAMLRPRANASARRARRATPACWLCVTLALVGYFSFVEYRLFSRPDANVPGIKLVHWTAPPESDEVIDWADRVVQWDGDITLMQGARGTWHDERVIDWLGPQSHPVVLGHFCLLSKLPVIEARTLIYREDVLTLFAITVATETATDGSLRVWLADMPANPRTSKSQLVAQARKLLDGLKEPAPDVIVGDFNMTRGSALLHRMFPAMRHAYEDAGHGYSATFPRKWPLYHIDHVLLSEDWRATRYDIVDPEAGRHRAQVAWIEAAP